MRTGAVEGLLESVSRVRPESASIRELADTIQRVEAARDLLAFHSARLVARFESRKGYQVLGFADLVSWFKSCCRVTGGAAMERLKVGRQLATLPSTSAALEQGEIGFAAASVIARAAGDVAPQSAAKMEALVLKAANLMDPGQLQLHAEKVACELNQAEFMEHQYRARARRRLDFGQRPDGLVSVQGLLDREGGALVMRAVDNLLGPRAAGDDRTPPQRRADALVELAEHSLSGRIDGSTGTKPTNATVTVGAEFLVGASKLPARLESMFAAGRETARRHLCDAAVTPIVVNSNGDSLHLGRAVRTVPPPMRRALASKFSTCGWEGCSRPIDWTHVHHLKHWIDGGPTDIENLVPVCSPHHRMLHEGGWDLRRDGPDGEVVPVRLGLAAARGS